MAARTVLDRMSLVCAGWRIGRHGTCSLQHGQRSLTGSVLRCRGQAIPESHGGFIMQLENGERRHLSSPMYITRCDNIRTSLRVLQSGRHEVCVLRMVSRAPGPRAAPIPPSAFDMPRDLVTAVGLRGGAGQPAACSNGLCERRRGCRMPRPPQGRVGCRGYSLQRMVASTVWH